MLEIIKTQTTRAPKTMASIRQFLFHIKIIRHRQSRTSTAARLPQGATFLSSFWPHRSSFSKVPNHNFCLSYLLYFHHIITPSFEGTWGIINFNWTHCYTKKKRSSFCNEERVVDGQWVICASMNMLSFKTLKI